MTSNLAIGAIAGKRLGMRVTSPRRSNSDQSQDRECCCLHDRFGSRASPSAIDVGLSISAMLRLRPMMRGGAICREGPTADSCTAGWQRHSITSAIASSVSGMVSPSALAPLLRWFPRADDIEGAICRSIRPVLIGDEFFDKCVSERLRAEELGCAITGP